MVKEYWISAYSQMGNQFGGTIEANNPQELFEIFRQKYPDCDLADYGEYELTPIQKILQDLEQYWDSFRSLGCIRR